MASVVGPESASVNLALVVNPDAATRRLHVSMLGPVAAEFDEADDGAEALARALARPPGLVVTELLLPRIDGYALCRMLRQEPSTSNTTILVVAASATPAQMERARRSGADDILVEPVRPDEVRMRAYTLMLRSKELRAMSTDANRRAAARIEQSVELFERSAQLKTRILSRAHVRQSTTTPPVTPPRLRCPRCDEELLYLCSHVGGVNAKFPEQWDDYQCVRCGAFEYRHRTRRLRPI